MRRVEKGFTLIELVIVMVILGILAAVAIPRFQDFSTDAKNAAVAGGVAAVGSAVAIETANVKGAPSATAVAARLPGSSCVAGVIEITGSGGKVQVPVLESAGTVATACTASIAGVGTGTFS